MKSSSNCITQEHQIKELKAWCEKYNETNIKEKLEQHQSFQSKTKRDLACLLYSGAVTIGMLPALALPVAIAAVVGVVVFEVVDYFKTTNNIQDINDKTKQLEAETQVLEQNQHLIQEKSAEMAENIDTLIARHNKLGKNFDGLITDLARMIILTT